MTKALPFALAALCVGLGAALAVQRSTIGDLRGEIDSVRGRIDRIESRQKESTTTAAAAAEELRAEVTRLERKAAAAPPSAPPPKSETVAPVAFTEEDVRKIVDERVDEKFQAQAAKGQGNGGDDRKMPLHDLAKELALDPAVQAKVAEIANRAKKEIFELLKTPRPDGTSMADDLLDALMTGEAAKAQAVFGRIFTEKIPGTETTYLAAAQNVQGSGRKDLERVMGTDAYGRFAHMNVHPENIETGFDPWGEYFAQKSGK